MHRPWGHRSDRYTFGFWIREAGPGDHPDKEAAGPVIQFLGYLAIDTHHLLMIVIRQDLHVFSWQALAQLFSAGWLYYAQILFVFLFHWNRFRADGKTGLYLRQLGKWKFRLAGV